MDRGSCNLGVCVSVCVCVCVCVFVCVIAISPHLLTRSLSGMIFGQALEYVVWLCPAKNWDQGVHGPTK